MKKHLIITYIVCFISSSFVVFAEKKADVKTLEYNFNLSSFDQVRPTSLDIMILFDHSKSMKTNDPDRIRMNAVLYLLDYLMANAQYYQINCRLGFVCFAGKPIHTLPLSLLTKTTRKTVKNYLLEEESYSFTDFQEPIHYAYQELKAKSFGSDNKRLVILFTDGRPQLNENPMTNKELDDYFKQLIPVITDLQTNQVPLFVLGIGDALEDMNNWSQLITKDQYVKISDINEISNKFHHIITNFFEFFSKYEGDIIKTNKITFEVEPLLERITFSFMLSQPNIKIQVKTPQGISIESAYGNNGEAYHSLFTIRNPDDGIWKIFKTGKGHVQYWFDAQYPIVQIKLDSTYPYTGYPFKIEATLLRNTFQVNRTDIIITAQIQTPKEKSNKLALYNAGDGIFKGDYKLTKIHGEYNVSANARWINTNKIINVRKIKDRITILPLPENEQKQYFWKYLSYVFSAIIILLFFLLIWLLNDRKSDRIKRVKDELNTTRYFLDKAINAKNKEIVINVCKANLDKLQEAHQQDFIDNAIEIFKKIFNVIDETDINNIINEFLVKAKSNDQKDAFTIHLKKYLVETKNYEIIDYLYHIDFNKTIVEDLLRYGKNERLKNIYFLERPDVNDINSLISAINALFSFEFNLSSFDSKKLSTILRKISNAFLQLKNKKCTYAEHAYVMYKYLSQLVENPLYPDYKAFPKDEKHSYFIALESYYKQLFHFEGTLEELIVNFNNLKYNLIKLKKLEFRAFIIIMLFWRRQVKEKFNYAKDINVDKVNIELAPELSIHSKSQNELYRVLIENLGEIPIYSVNFLEIDDSREQNSEYHISSRNINKIQLIPPCNYKLIELNVTKNTPKTITTAFQISYNTWFQKNIIKSVEIVLPEIKFVKEPLQNPFIVMKPIPKTQQYEFFYNIESRKNALNKLKEIIESKNFNLINLHGLRRIGKTSMVNQLRDQKCTNIFPIHIDCNIWKNYSPYNYKKDDILCSLFDYKIYDGIREQYDTYVKPKLNKIDNNNYYSELVKSYAQFLKRKEKVLVIILDDAHYLSNPNIISDNEKHSSLSYLRFLASEAEKNNADYSIVLITEKNIADFTEDKYKFIPHIISLSLLDDEEICEISQMYNILAFSSLALAYMVRYSGGYTSVIQAICHRLVIHCNDKNSSTVLLSDIQEVVNNIVKTSSFRPYLSYLVGGLTEAEQIWLSQLIQKNKIDSFTMYINIQQDEIGEFEKKIIDNLRYKQIIETNEVICESELKTLYKLRIGIFKTLIEEWKIGIEAD